MQSKRSCRSDRRLCTAPAVCDSMSSKPRLPAPATMVVQEDPYTEFCRLAKQYRELRSIVRSTPKPQHRESGPPCTADVTPSQSQHATSILSNGVDSPQVETGAEVAVPAAAPLDTYSDEQQTSESDTRNTRDSEQRNSNTFSSSNSPNQSRLSQQLLRAQQRSAIYCPARVSGAMTACRPPRNTQNDADCTTHLLRPGGTRAPGRRRCRRRRQQRSRDTTRRVSQVNRVHRGDGDEEGGLGRGKVDAMAPLNLETAMAIAFDVDRNGRGRGLSASAVRNICRERRIKQQQDAVERQKQHRNARAKSLDDIHEFLRNPKIPCSAPSPGMPATSDEAGVVRDGGIIQIDDRLRDGAIGQESSRDDKTNRPTRGSGVSANHGSIMLIITSDYPAAAATDNAQGARYAPAGGSCRLFDNVDVSEVLRDDLCRVRLVRDVRHALRAGQAVRVRTFCAYEGPQLNGGAGGGNGWKDCQLMLRNLYMQSIQYCADPALPPIVPEPRNPALPSGELYLSMEMEPVRRYGHRRPGESCHVLGDYADTGSWGSMRGGDQLLPSLCSRSKSWSN